MTLKVNQGHLQPSLIMIYSNITHDHDASGLYLTNPSINDIENSSFSSSLALGPFGI